MDLDDEAGDQQDWIAVQYPAHDATLRIRSVSSLVLKGWPKVTEASLQEFALPEADKDGGRTRAVLNDTFSANASATFLTRLKE